MVRQLHNEEENYFLHNGGLPRPRTTSYSYDCYFILHLCFFYYWTDWTNKANKSNYSKIPKSLNILS